MIKQLRIHNYLSIREVTLDLRLRNVLVGPNMSGKSNVVDALRFLTHIALSGLMNAINNRGGFSEILWKGIEEGQISFFLTLEVPSESDESPRVYIYELSLTGSTKAGTEGAFFIEKETLKRSDDRGEYILADFRNGKGKGFHRDGSVAFTTEMRSTKSFLEYSIPGWEGMDIKDIISSWRYYRLNPFAMRQQNMITDQLSLNSTR